MFVCSLRAGTLRFFGVIALALAVLVTLIAFVPALTPVKATAAEPARENRARTDEERVAYLASYGWQVSEKPAESETVTLPKDFDKVFAAYNELQKRQGFDLSDYAGKTVERYTYTVGNYPDYEGVVYANLLVSRGRVIGGDVCSAEANGFLHGFQK